MSDGSLFVDIIPDFSTLRKKAKGEKVEVGTKSSKATGEGVSTGKGGILGKSGGLMKMLGKIGAAVFVISKLMEVFQPVIEVIGAIVKTLGLLLIPLVRLLLVLLTPVLKWLANFVSDFLTDPFGAILRGIRDIFTQLLPELLTGLANAIGSALETALPSWLVNTSDGESRVQRLMRADPLDVLGSFAGASVLGPVGALFGGDIRDAIGSRFNRDSQGATINVEGITDDSVARNIEYRINKDNSNYGRFIP